MSAPRYIVDLTTSAQRELDKLERTIARRIVAALRQLEVEPRPHGVKKLAGKADLYRVRVGDFRIVYTIEDDKLIVLVVKIADRKQIYK